MLKASGNTGKHDNPTSDIPRRIKMLRTALHMTAAEMDRMTDLSAGTIRRLERGEQRIYANHLYRIARVTGVDVGWFYRTKDEPSNITNIRDYERQCLLEAYMRITNPALRHDVLELITALSQAPGD